MKLYLWLYDMYQVRKIYNQLLFSKRQEFMSELRPITEHGSRIAYPDAIFFIQDKDIKRSMRKLVLK